MRQKTGDKSVYVYQKPKLNFELKIRERDDLTDKQRDIIDKILAKKTKLTFLGGPAGSSKSFCAILAGLKLLNEKKVSNILYIRPVLESADPGSKLGFLPGGAEEKLEPYSRVCIEKLEEMLPPSDINKLNAEKRIEVIPVNFLRGASWNAQYVVVDEAQSFTYGELKTLVTRIGHFSKIVICADPSQSDLGESKQGAFERLSELFNDEESQEMGIYSFKFNEEDIVRSEICKFIVKKLNK